MDTFGTSASISGIAIAVVTLFSGLTSMIYGRVKGRFGYVYIMVISFLAIGFGYTIISSSANAPGLIIGLIIIGIGFGTFIPNVNTWLAEVAPEKYRGRVMGGITTFVFLGQFLSPIATQPIQVAFEIPGLYLTSGAYLLITGTLLLLFRNPLIRLCERVSKA
jgi:MFS family permease